MADLARARELVDRKEIEMVKNIEILQLEGLFKSDAEEKRREAEKRFDELIEKYGRDSRLQRLALDLGKWHQEQGHYVVAADVYKGIADRAGTELSQDDILKLLFLAGKLYTRAAGDAYDRGLHDAAEAYAERIRTAPNRVPHELPQKPQFVALVSRFTSQPSDHKPLQLP